MTLVAGKDSNARPDRLPGPPPALVIGPDGVPCVGVRVPSCADVLEGRGTPCCGDGEDRTCRGGSGGECGGSGGDVEAPPTPPQDRRGGNGGGVG